MGLNRLENKQNPGLAERSAGEMREKNVENREKPRKGPRSRPWFQPLFAGMKNLSNNTVKGAKSCVKRSRLTK